MRSIFCAAALYLHLHARGTSCAVHVWALCARQWEMSMGWERAQCAFCLNPLASCCACVLAPPGFQDLWYGTQGLACTHGFGFWFSSLFGRRTFLGKTSSGQVFPNWIQEETKPHRTEHGLANFRVSWLCFRRRAELPVDTDSVTRFHNFKSYQDQLCRVPPMISFTFQFCRFNNDRVSCFQEIKVTPFPFADF